MSKRYCAMFLFIILASLTLLAGCGSKENDVLAVVGTEDITVEDFEYFSRGLVANFASAQEEFDRKRALLDTMIHNRLMVRVAYEYGLDRSDEVARVVLANKDKFLLDVLYQKNVLDNVKVTRAEVREFWDNLEYKIRAYQIVVKNKDTAQMLFERARAGENFEQLAFDYSTDADARRNRGDLGFFVWGAMVQEFQEVAFQMQPGELSPPIETRYGWHIIKLIDKLSNSARGEFADMAPGIERQILNRKQVYQTEDYFQDIKSRYPIKIDSATCDYVMFKREELYPPQILASLPRSDFDTEQLDRSEKELVLATWEGGQVSLYEYLTAIQRVPVQFRPDLDNYGELPELVFEIKKLDILAFEANKQGIQNDEKFKKRLSMFKELSMADLLRIDFINPNQEISEVMARNYFEREQDLYTIPRRIHLFEILTSDELLANKLSKEINTLARFKKQAQRYTERPAQKNTDGDLGYIEQKYFKEVFPVAWKISVGSIGGPIATLGKHSVFWVVDKAESELRDFFSVKQQIVQVLLQEQSQAAYAKWVHDHVSETDIEVFEDALWSAIDVDKYAARETDQSANN